MDKSYEEELVDSPRKMELMDLPSEILTKIFSYLNMMSLITMADVGQRSRANVKKDLKFNNRLSQVVVGNFEAGNKISLYPCRFELEGVGCILKFLRIFGENIKILSFNGDLGFEQNAFKIFHYVNHFLKNLKDLTLIHVFYDLSQACSVRFNTVSKLSFRGCIIRQGLCDIRPLFPNLSGLNFYGKNSIEYISKTIEEYPKIKTIYVSGDSMALEHVQILQDINFQMKIMYNGVWLKR